MITYNKYTEPNMERIRMTPFRNQLVNLHHTRSFSTFVPPKAVTHYR